jgi:hypothetical protein
MKTTRTLMLAAVAALSLGVGSAMAQGGDAGPFPDFQSQRVLQQRVLTPTANDPQSGSSDILNPTGADRGASSILTRALAGTGGGG